MEDVRNFIDFKFIYCFNSSMKILPSEFIKNVDSCGDHRFIQLYRDENIALYIRKKLNEVIFGYECFKIKTVKAGTQLPGGALVEEDYEVYPSKNAFGKSAIYISGPHIIKPEVIIEMFKKRFSAIKTEESSEESEFKIPSDFFTIKMLMTLNPDKTYIECYNFIKSQLGTHLKIVEDAILTSGKGRAANVYQKI